MSAQIGMHPRYSIMYAFYPVDLDLNFSFFFIFRIEINFLHRLPEIIIGLLRGAHTSRTVYVSS